jgi:tetratricopeptide (TPR) repeat protein
MKIRNRYIFPFLFLLSFTALAMKKLMIPFHGFFLVVIFDGMAIFYFLRALTAEKPVENAPGRSFNFDLGSIVYAISSIAILYRLQQWDGWQRWTAVAGVLFFVVSILTLISFYFIFRLPGRKEKIKRVAGSNLSWFYFLFMLPVVTFLSPRTFHNLFNGTTYEEFVRTHYPLEEGTALLAHNKPSGERALLRAQALFERAMAAEKAGEYDVALRNFNLAIDLNPDHSAALYHRGRLKLTRLELSWEMANSAYDDFSRAIQLDPSMAAAYYHRAVVHNYLDPKHRLKAQLDFMKARELDSSLKDDRLISDFLSQAPLDIIIDSVSYNPTGDDR